MKVLAALAIIVAVVAADVYFKETFDGKCYLQILFETTNFHIFY